MTEADISVVVATFGDRAEWEPRAQRAITSANWQTLPPVEVIHVHSDSGSLAEARNVGGRRARGDWLCFLDADDELDATYIANMDVVAANLGRRHRDLLIQPSTVGVVDGRRDPEPVLIPRRPLIDANFLVIGTLVRREQFLRVGGFRDLPVLEDWDLWLRCYCDGADLAAAPSAVYVVHVRAGSRNTDDARVAAQIRAQHRAAYESRKGAKHA